VSAPSCVHPLIGAMIDNQRALERPDRVDAELDAVDFVVQFLVPTPLAGAICQVEIRLEETDLGTHFAEIIGKSTGPLLARMTADAGMKARQDHIRELVATFKKHIEDDQSVRSQSALPTELPISPSEIATAARSALAEVPQANPGIS